jgi:hypothetical protein
MIRGREVALSLASFAIGAGMAAGSYYLEDYWRHLLLDAAMVFVALSAGLLAVNFYLDMRARRSAIEPLLELVEPSIQQHHNDFLDKAWDRLGKSQFSKLVDRYEASDRDPLVLTPDERDSIYEMVRSDKESFFRLYEQLEEELKELALILGWSFDPSILQHSFNCRYSIARMKGADFDDTDATKAEVCKLFLDIDLNAFALHLHLAKLQGLRMRDLYYE